MSLTTYQIDYIISQKAILELYILCERFSKDKKNFSEILTFHYVEYC